MKITFKVITALALVVVLMSCNDRASEKRIAELESRLAQVEGNKGATTPAITPDATTAPEEKP
ncbi:MAG TPA: hypothetical protein PKC10_15875, partial [Cyclobacteriaceae bacterium]|nr:hypothetical protein [Cyclobacteriaceae bacterium]